jgi:hypothetical protein
MYENLRDEELLLIWEFSQLSPEKKKKIIEYIKSIMEMEAEYSKWINTIREKVFEIKVDKKFG